MIQPLPTIEAAPAEISGLGLEQRPLDANAKIARHNRTLLDRHGITAIDFVGASGAGKTTLIIRLTEKMNDQLGVAVVNGEAPTSPDAAAFARLGVPVVQLTTEQGHLDATLVAQALDQIPLRQTGLIFIENIGNMNCPAEFPLGAKARVGVVSVTEASYMVKKHPRLFLDAPMVILNKTDLTAAMEISIPELIRDIHILNPDLKVIPASGKTGAGMVGIAAALLAL